MLGLNSSVRSIASFSAIALVISLSSACGSGSDGGGNTPAAGSPSSVGGAGSGTSGAPSGGASGGSTPAAGGSSAGSTNGGSSASAGAGGAGTAGGAVGGATGNSGGSGGGSAGSGVGGTRVPGTNGYNCTPPSGTLPVLQATAIVSTGLSQPMLVTHTPDGAADRFFVVERAGKIRIVDKGAVVTKPFLDITSKVVAGAANGDERGFLGLAFHPSYAQNGLFYVHYSDKADANDSGDSIIEEYKVSSTSPDEADPASARLVLKVEQTDQLQFLVP